MNQDDPWWTEMNRDELSWTILSQMNRDEPRWTDMNQVEP